MAAIYETTKYHGLVLYTYQNQILLCDKLGRYFGRPVILADDYSEQLQDIYFPDTIYYSYFNTDKKFILRNIMEPQPLFIGEKALSSPLCHPQLITFQNSIFLLWSEYDANRQLYLVKGQTVPDKTQSLVLPDFFSSSPRIIASASDAVLVLHVFNGSQYSNIYEIKEDYSVISHSSCQAETARLNAIIESITVQYNDLMNVAEQYRGEAIKWREKFIRKK